MPSLKSGVTLKGADGVARALVKLNEKVRVGSGRALLVLANLVIDESKSRTPVDTGLLRSSAFVDSPSTSASGRYTTVEIGYGNGTRAEDYAEIQHDETSYYHAIGEDHYLFNAINVYLSKGAKVLRDELQEVLSGGSLY